MPRGQKFKPEEIVAKLREAEVESGSRQEGPISVRRSWWMPQVRSSAERLECVSSMDLSSAASKAAAAANSTARANSCV